MRDFGRWARINGNQNALVLSDQWKAGFVRSQPYPLANTGIRFFFQAASREESSSRRAVPGRAEAAPRILLCCVPS